MMCSRFFVCWAIAVCLASCFCESTEATNTAKKQKTDTEKAVDELQILTDKVLINATRLKNHANSLRARVETNKHNADDAISLVQHIPENNEKAKEIATKVKEISKEIIERYPNASEAANATFQKMKELVTEAEKLKEKAYNDTLTHLTLSSDFKQINESIKAVKTQIETFKTKLQEEKPKLKSASILEVNMSKLVPAIKVEKYHFSVILSVIQIDNALKKADINIGTTKNKVDEVNTILKEMIQMSPKVTDSSTANVNVMIEKAKNALSTATKAVEDAKKLKEEMLLIKTNANNSLPKFTNTTKPEHVEAKVKKTQKYVQQVAEKTRKIEEALQSAETAAKSAKSAKESLLKVLSEGKTQHSGKVTKDSEQTLNSATDTHQNGSNTDLTMKTSKNAVNGISANSRQQASVKLASDKEQLLNVQNLNISNDKLPNGAKSGTNIALVNGKPSVSGDGSMILSVPLLAALIASAVLH